MWGLVETCVSGCGFQNLEGGLLLPDWGAIRQHVSFRRSLLVLMRHPAVTRRTFLAGSRLQDELVGLAIYGNLGRIFPRLDEIALCVGPRWVSMDDVVTQA